MTSAATGGQSAWVTSPAAKDTAPNSGYSPDPGSTGVNELVTPSIAVPSRPTRLNFRHNYDMEAGTASTAYDGACSRLASRGAPTLTLSPREERLPTALTRMCSAVHSAIRWVGGVAGAAARAGFTTASIDLPPAALGQNVRLKWRCASDSSTAAPVGSWTPSP